MAPLYDARALVPFQLSGTNLSSAFGLAWEGVLWRSFSLPSYEVPGKSWETAQQNLRTGPEKVGTALGRRS